MPVAGKRVLSCHSCACGASVLPHRVYAALCYACSVFFIDDNICVKTFVCAITCCSALVFSNASVVAQESAAAKESALSTATTSARAAAPVNGVDDSASAAQSGVMSDIIVEGSPLPQPNPDAEKKKNWFDKYLPYEQQVAGWVDNTARGVDRFFGTDDAWRVDNDSWLRLTNDVSWEQEKGVSNDLRLRLKLDVPTATRRLHLLIESEPETQFGATPEAAPALNNGSPPRTTVLGLGTNFEGWLPGWKKQLQGGLRFALPIDPYARFIMRRDVPLGGQWEFNSYNRLQWFHSDGYAVKSELRFGEPLTPNWRLYYSTDLDWREKLDYLEFAESANLAHILSTRSAITYSLGFSGTGFETPQITKYFLTADYRRNIARRIIFFDVIPELSLPDEYGFDPHWAITLRLELYFQKKVEADD